MKKVLLDIIKANEDLFNNKISDKAYDAFLDKVEKEHNLKIKNEYNWTTSLRDISDFVQWNNIWDKEIPDIIITTDSVVNTDAKLADVIINDDKLLAYHLKKDTGIICNMHLMWTMFLLQAYLSTKKVKIVDSVSAVINDSNRSYVINVLYTKGVSNEQ